MKIEHWKYENVDKKGICEGGGAVHVEQMVRVSPPQGGCDIDTCHCSDGHWLCINFGRDAETETVSGVTVKFDNAKEMAELLGYEEYV